MKKLFFLIFFLPIILYSQQKIISTPAITFTGYGDDVKFSRTMFYDTLNSKLMFRIGSNYYQIAPDIWVKKTGDTAWGQYYFYPTNDTTEIPLVYDIKWSQDVDNSLNYTFLVNDTVRQTLNRDGRIQNVTPASDSNDVVVLKQIIDNGDTVIINVTNYYNGGLTKIFGSAPVYNINDSTLGLGYNAPLYLNGTLLSLKYKYPIVNINDSLGFDSTTYLRNTYVPYKYKVFCGPGIWYYNNDSTFTFKIKAGAGLRNTNDTTLKVKLIAGSGLRNVNDSTLKTFLLAGGGLKNINDSTLGLKALGVSPVSIVSDSIITVDTVILATRAWATHAHPYVKYTDTSAMLFHYLDGAEYNIFLDSIYDHNIRLRRVDTLTFTRFLDKADTSQMLSNYLDGKDTVMLRYDLDKKLWIEDTNIFMRDGDKIAYNQQPIDTNLHNIRISALEGAMGDYDTSFLATKTYVNDNFDDYSHWYIYSGYNSKAITSNSSLRFSYLITNIGTSPFYGYLDDSMMYVLDTAFLATRAWAGHAHPYWTYSDTSTTLATQYYASQNGMQVHSLNGEYHNGSPLLMSNGGTGNDTWNTWDLWGGDRLVVYDSANAKLRKSYMISEMTRNINLTDSLQIVRDSLDNVRDTLFNIRTEINNFQFTDTTSLSDRINSHADSLSNHNNRIYDLEVKSDTGFVTSTADSSYIPKMSGQNELVNSSIRDSSGRIRINTDTINTSITSLGLGFLNIAGSFIYPAIYSYSAAGEGIFTETGTGTAIWGEAQNPTGVGVRGNHTTGTAILGSSLSGKAFYGYTNSNYAIHGLSISRPAIYGESIDSAGVATNNYFQAAGYNGITASTLGFIGGILVDSTKIGSGSGTLKGTGAANYLPKFVTADSVGNSSVRENTDSIVISKDMFINSKVYVANSSISENIPALYGYNPSSGSGILGQSGSGIGVNGYGNPGVSGTCSGGGQGVRGISYNGWGLYGYNNDNGAAGVATNNYFCANFQNGISGTFYYTDSTGSVASITVTGGIVTGHSGGQWASSFVPRETPNLANYKDDPDYPEFLEFQKFKEMKRRGKIDLNNSENSLTFNK
jgi:hypothetical protein